jgi:hypothetical protein
MYVTDLQETVPLLSYIHESGLQGWLDPGDDTFVYIASQMTTLNFVLRVVNENVVTEKRDFGPTTALLYQHPGFRH